MLVCHVTGVWQQLIEHSRISRRAVGSHLHWARAALQSAKEESARGRQIPLLRDQNIDNLPELVDCPVRAADGCGRCRY
jgi:hypothetical protein